MEIIGSIEDGIKDLVKVWDSFYLYDLNIMDQRMDDLSYLPQNVHTFYAMKANPNKDVIKRALEHQNISGIEVASKGEIKIVQEVQGSKDLRNLIYTGPSKTNLELEISVQNDIKYLNVESCNY